MKPFFIRAFGVFLADLSAPILVLDPIPSYVRASKHAIKFIYGPLKTVFGGFISAQEVPWLCKRRPDKTNKQSFLI